MSHAAPDTLSPKSRLAAALLAGMLGPFGAHRFYVGKTGTAILQLVTLGGLGIWSTIDLILILVGAFRDEHGLLIRRWESHEGPQPSTSRASMDEHLDRLDEQLTALQSTMIDMVDKVERLEKRRS